MFWVAVGIAILWCIAMYGDNSIPRDKNGRPDR